MRFGPWCMVFHKGEAPVFKQILDMGTFFDQSLKA